MCKDATKFNVNQLKLTSLAEPSLQSEVQKTICRFVYRVVSETLLVSNYRAVAKFGKKRCVVQGE